MKVLLVEDEKIIADEILVQLHDLGYTDVVHRQGSTDAMQDYRDHEVDLVIMDIGLADSPIDGIELSIQMLEERPCPLIFLSAYSDGHTLRRVQAVEHDSYLVKPCSTRQLFVSIEEAMRRHYSTQPPSTEVPLYTDPAHFFIKKNTHYEKVSIADVLWISATRGGILIHTTHGKYILTASLSSIERQLGHPSLLRIHKSHIINKQHVMAIGEKEAKIIHGSSEVILACGTTYLTDFRKHFFKLKSD